MPLAELVPALVLLVGCLLLAAFFAASETSLFSLRRSERSRLASEGTPEARAANDLIERPRTLLIVILLAGVAIDALFFSFSADLAASLAKNRGAWVIPAFGAASVLLMLVVGEITPKAIAATSPRRVALLAARPLRRIRDLLRPVTLPVEKALSKFLDIIERRLPERRGGLGDAELVKLVEQEQAEGRIERRASELLADVLELRARRVKEVMVPRVDVQAFDLNDGRDRFLAGLRERRHEHLPVHEGGGLDKVFGVLRGRRVLAAPDVPLAKLVEPARFVPETMSLETLLRTLATEKRTVAIVVDEHGGTAGLVTLEDVIEEIVGDISSPLDKPLVQPTGDGTWILSGRLGLREAGDILGVRFPAKGPTTLSGYLALRLGRVPEKGDQVVFPNVRLRVEAVARRRATEILAERTGKIASP